MEDSPIEQPQAQPCGPSLHIGLLIDRLTVSKYIYDFTQWAQSQPNITVTGLILQPEDGSGDPLGLLSRSLNSVRRNERGFALAHLAFFLLRQFERMLIRRNRRHSEHLLEFDLSPLLENRVVIRANVSNSESGQVYRFDEADTQRVKNLKLDLLVRWENGILHGEILHAARLGVISVHLGDSRSYRGGPPGFWEVYRREDMTGFAIERLSGDIGTSDVLMEGRFATQHYYMFNEALGSKKATFYLKLIIQRIALTGRVPERRPNTPYSYQPFKNPSFLEVGIYFAKYCCAVLLKKIKSLLYIHYRWSVAYVFQNWRDAKLCRAITLKNRPFHYLADPYVISRNGKNYCFVEDFDYRRRRGSIDVYELAASGGIRIGTALTENFHLSFPYIFEYRNELFMCPESSANRDIRIYRCVDFPLQWKLEKIIMSQVSAVDTMLFEKDEKWWMLTNVDVADVGDYRSELCIFSAGSPLDETWEPHPLNPVIVDASRARNAGGSFNGGAYFRFSQGQGFDFYGKRVLINEIIELDATNYVESTIATINPSFLPGIVGTHHMHSNGHLTVFDVSKTSNITTGQH